MMKLVSMKIEPGTKDPVDQPQAADQPQYPWGLQLHLGNDEMAKLGIETEEDADVGAEVTIMAKGIVTGYSMHKRQGGEDYRCCDIQITDLGIDGGEEKSAAETVYPKAKD